MPGQFRKPPMRSNPGKGIGKPASAPARPFTPPRPSVTSRPFAAPKPAAKPIAIPKPMMPKPAAPVRPSAPAGGFFRRSTTPERMEGRDLRRSAMRSAAQTIDQRVRPVVRPGTPPLKQMTKGVTAQPIQVGRPRPGAMPRPAGMRAGAPGVNIGQLIGAAAVGALASNIARSYPDMTPDAQALQMHYSQMESGVGFDELQADIVNLDNALNHAVNLLEGARQKGYAFGRELETKLNQTISAWQSTREQVNQSIASQSNTYMQQALSYDQRIQQLHSMGNMSAAAGQVRQLNAQLAQFNAELARSQASIEDLYDDLMNSAQQISARLTQIHWMLDAFQAAKFALERGEDAVAAVQARWDQQGDQDPEGLLYLTTKRIIFERKETVAVKKILFITTESKLVHEVILNQPVSGIKDSQANNKGLFGHQDFLGLTFAEKSIGEISLHLHGQSNKLWLEMIHDVQTGAIDQQRSSGNSLSVADLARPLTQADLVSLQSEVNELQDELMLKEVRNELEALENELNGLQRRLTGLRNNGYLIEKSLEADLAVLQAQWDGVKTRANTVMDREATTLDSARQNIQAALGKLLGLSGNLAAAKPAYVELKSLIASAEAQAEAAEDTVMAQFDAYDDEVDGFSAHMDWVDWMLQALTSASFRLLANESGVAAVEAVWERASLEPENGILFLTDQRLIWEDRVDTFEMKFETPLANIESVEVEDDEAGQLLVVKLVRAEPAAVVRFRLGADVGGDWLRMTGRARKGDYATDRAVQITAEEIERIQKAPTQCSNCGAAFTAPILRGQNEIVCEYCGVVTRL